LAHGWAHVPQAAPLFQEAWQSQSGELCLVGVLGLAATGTLTDQTRDAALRGQNFWSNVSYPYQGLAATLLMKYWARDEALIKTALNRASRDFNSLWEHDVAVAFLLESSTDRSDVCDWILAELAGEFPFNVVGDRRRTWGQ